jgi:hypothetical protein
LLGSGSRNGGGMFNRTTEQYSITKWDSLEH